MYKEVILYSYLLMEMLIFYINVMKFEIYIFLFNRYFLEYFYWIWVVLNINEFELIKFFFDFFFEY